MYRSSTYSSTVGSRSKVDRIRYSNMVNYATIPYFHVLGPMLPVYDGRENLYTPEPVPTIPELAQADLGNHF